MKTITTLVILLLSTCFLFAQTQGKPNPKPNYKVKWGTGKTEIIRQTAPRAFPNNNTSCDEPNNTFNKPRLQKIKSTPIHISIGLDVPIFITRSLVDVPLGLRDGITDHSGGVGYDFGLGLNIDFNDNVSLKFGFHKWNKLFSANYNAFVEDLSGNERGFFIEENGEFNYLGLYLKAHYNFDHFFVGGGFEVSLNKKYNADYIVLNSTGKLVSNEFGVKNTPLIEEYNHQIDFSMIAGLRYKINEKLIVKPAIELIAAPIRPIINTGVYSTINNERNEVNINIFALKIGAVIEFKL